jgi:hypothetical protein
MTLLVEKKRPLVFNASPLLGSARLSRDKTPVCVDATLGLLGCGTVPLWLLVLLSLIRPRRSAEAVLPLTGVDGIGAIFRVKRQKIAPVAT